MINLEELVKEINYLKANNLNLDGRLLISDRAHITLPSHTILEQWREGGSHKIGTTGRGIGPTYEAKIARIGVRVCDLFNYANLVERMQLNYEETKLLTGTSFKPTLIKDAANYLINLIQPLVSFIGNTQEYLWHAWQTNNSILFEGAQAVLLDIDHGTYPYVTSSNCSIGGLLTGTGLPPKAVNHTLGVIKAYTTRVGAGPMFAELENAMGELIRQRGNECGATTGRSRRCGWFDTVATRYACRVNGVDGLGAMKIDVLDHLAEVGMIIGYRDGNGGMIKQLPACAADWAEVQPVIKMFKGWSQSTRGIVDSKQLPIEAARYLAALSDAVETPIAYLSTGPERNEGHILSNSFLNH